MGSSGVRALASLFDTKDVAQAGQDGISVFCLLRDQKHNRISLALTLLPRTCPVSFSYVLLLLVVRGPLSVNLNWKDLLPTRHNIKLSIISNTSISCIPHTHLPLVPGMSFCPSALGDASHLAGFLHLHLYLKRYRIMGRGGDLA